jgi:hypothetical protein
LHPVPPLPPLGLHRRAVEGRGNWLEVLAVLEVAAVLDRRDRPEVADTPGSRVEVGREDRLPAPVGQRRVEVRQRSVTMVADWSGRRTCLSR